MIPASSRAFITVHNATFRLGERLIFPRTSLVFRRHEHWAILGCNGSGKSLFADALRGVLPLVEGTVEYHFRPPAGLTAVEAVGYVSFEERRHEVHEMVVQSRWNSIEAEAGLRVRDYLAFERVMEINPFEVGHHRAKDRHDFEVRQHRAVRLLEIEAFLARTLPSLSNGERQRVELARSLCRPLRLLILDEPFAGLDTASRRLLYSVLRRLMATPLRVMLITSREDDLPREITHVLRVRDCRVVFADPRTLMERGAHTRFSTASKSRDFGSPEMVPANSAQPVRAPGGGERKAAQDRRTPGRFARGVRRPASNLVELRDVSVRYGNRIILKGASWTIQAGESWALLGPNGSGKTTLLSVILGDNPQSYVNQVVVFGKRRDGGESIWNLRKQIGWVSPELHLYFDTRTTVFEAVASGFFESIGLFESLSPRQRQAANRWLRRFQLLKFAHAPLFALSTGLQRMALLARALVKEPQLLILDEPCHGLDPHHRELILWTVDELVKGGSVTAIYVTHRNEEIPPSIRRVLRLKHGKAVSR